MEQVAAGARSLPLHVSLLMANSPTTPTVLIWRATVLGFLRVVVFTTLIAPTTTLPNTKVRGVTVSLPAMPTPLSADDPAFAFAASFTASDAVRVPSAAGVKVSVTVQLVPGASVEPHALLEIVNSLASPPLS